MSLIVLVSGDARSKFYALALKRYLIVTGLQLCVASRRQFGSVWNDLQSSDQRRHRDAARVMGWDGPG